MTILQDISVDEALAIILAEFETLPAEEVSLLAARNRTLAEAIIAGEQLPPFPNSAMDGFALRADDVAGASEDRPKELLVIGEIAAGDTPSAEVTPGTVIRIMTGAPMPPGADAVIPVEDTSEMRAKAPMPLPKSVSVFRAVSPGAYVRQAGEDVRTGSLVLETGTRIRPQEIGLLASLGFASVKVVRKPRVGILATGNELVGVEEPLVAGKIRNSNGYVQAAQVEEAGGIPVSLGVAGDSADDLAARLNEGVYKAVDLFVSSAGVSVGAYDVVKHLLEQEGQVRFWRVRIRPGKPLTFGSYAGIPYLGLPGNPVSAMVTFERFARPAILKMRGRQELRRPSVSVTLEGDLQFDGRESYVRAVVRESGDGYRATLLGAQGSHMMTSLTQANALVVVPEGMETVSSGMQLEAIMLDWPETVF